MSFRPRKIVTEKKLATELFSSSDVVDFKSGVVFEAAKPETNSSADVANIRQVVADAMIKAAADSGSSNKYLSAPSVDDIERTVRAQVKKHWDMNMESKTSVEDTVRSILAEQRHVSAQVANTNQVPQISRANVEMAVRKALSEHMTRSDFTKPNRSATAMSESTPRVLSRDIVENAVRTALLKHMPTSPVPQQTDAEYDRIELAVRQAIRKNLGTTNFATASTGTTSATSASRGNQMRDLLY